MAHLLEHLVFKGTPRHPNIPQELSQHGADPNGTTWTDRTNYYETFPASDANLTWALDLEADRMINSFIAQKDLVSEMTVVRNEFELGENDPSNILEERITSTAFLWHNYGNSTIGARSDLENVPIERLQAFYHRHYQPDNALLVVAGRFDPATAIRLIEQKFGSIPRPKRTGDNVLWPTYTRDPEQDGERSVTLRRVGDVQVAMALYKVPPRRRCRLRVGRPAGGDTALSALGPALQGAGRARHRGQRVGQQLFLPRADHDRGPRPGAEGRLARRRRAGDGRDARLAVDQAADRAKRWSGPAVPSSRTSTCCSTSRTRSG